MVVIKTYYTNSGKYITKDIVSNIYKTYQKMCKKYTKSIIHFKLPNKEWRIPKLQRNSYIP